MELLASAVPDIAVVRRMLYATANLPCDIPEYWDIVRDFATRGSKLSLECSQVQLLMENAQILCARAFDADHQLQRELAMLSRPPSGQPLGVILISSKTECYLCGSDLAVRSDRPSSITLYTECMGTVPAKHYRKFCRSSGCTVVQHYGYTSAGHTDGVLFDKDWSQLKYFVSSQETAFELSLLRR